MEYPAKYGTVYQYEDLDGDGKKEFLEIENFSNLNMAMIIYNKNMKLIDQYNLPRFFPRTVSKKLPYCIDVNNDGLKEIFILSQKEDSLFMNVFDYKQLKFTVVSKFITTVGLNKKRDYSYAWITHEDINGNGYEEIYFEVIAGFSLYPRKIFRYDYKNNHIISSINTGAKQLIYPFHDTKGELFFLCGSSATDNCKEDFPFPYRDTCSWVFAYDKNLKLKFEPIPFIGKASSTYRIKQSGSRYFFLFTNNGTGNEQSRIVYLDETGCVIDSAFFMDGRLKMLYEIEISGKRYCYIQYQKDDKANVRAFLPEQKKFSSGQDLLKIVNAKLPPISVDIDNDDIKEHFFFNLKTLQAELYRNDLSHPVEFNLGKGGRGIKYVTTNYKNGRVRIILRGDEKFYFYDYFKNPNYWFKYPYWFLVYAVSFLFVWLVQLVQKRLINKQNSLQNRIIHLQLQNAQNQLDPHFTFNALNTVSNYIFKEDKYKAYDLFERFSRLMRSSLAFSDRIFRNLKDELQFTEDYLEFQKNRFKKRFDYEIKVTDDIDKTKVQIPKMLIQGFAENAVKHAFVNIDYKGLLKINIEKKSGQILIIIEDNGIGINASKEANPIPKSGYGMHILEEQIGLINKLYEQKISYEIIDKSTEGNALSGTKVVLSINIAVSGKQVS